MAVGMLIPVPKSLESMTMTYSLVAKIRRAVPIVISVTLCYF